jgi:predicted nuclease of predicted toxin-antitoxin system
VADRVKFYMDEHIAKSVTEGLRRRGVDVVTAQEANMHSAADDKHLALAASQGRVIFSQDADFLRLHAAGVPHHGIVYVPQQTPTGYIIRNLILSRRLTSGGAQESHWTFAAFVVKSP